MTQKIGNPVPLFLDASGDLLFGGQVYIGIADGDPQTQPVTAYWDVALTQVAMQPIQVMGGRLVNGTNPSDVYIAETDYSMRVLDARDVLIDYTPTTLPPGNLYQLSSSDLSAIAALSTTVFGRNLLTVADAAGLLAQLGSIPYLSTSGGRIQGTVNVSGNIFTQDGTYQLGTTGQTYTGLDDNGYIVVNGGVGLFMRINPVSKTFDFLIDDVKVCHIGTSGLVTP